MCLFRSRQEKKRTKYLNCVHYSFRWFQRTEWNNNINKTKNTYWHRSYSFLDSMYCIHPYVMTDRRKVNFKRTTWKQWDNKEIMKANIKIETVEEKNLTLFDRCSFFFVLVSRKEKNTIFFFVDQIVYQVVANYMKHSILDMSKDILKALLIYKKNSNHWK